MTKPYTQLELFDEYVLNTLDGPINLAADVPPNWRRLGPVAVKFVSGLAPDST